MVKPTVIVVGAGLAGLTCAHYLQQAGQQVIVVDKSRGIGGRVATRRLEDTCVDHGLPAWEVQGAATQDLCDRFTQAGQIQAIATAPGQFASPLGMTQGVKAWAAALTVQRPWRLAKLNVTAIGWQLTSEDAQAPPLYSPQVVLAIPAPQALDLLRTIPLTPPQLAPLAEVEFHPCLTVIAGYHNRVGDRLPFRTAGQDPRLAWLIVDSHKRAAAGYTTLVLHSSPQFAQTHLDLPDYAAQATRTLLPLAAEQWSEVALTAPAWVQVHRWRYARTRQPLGQPCWFAPTPWPLVCCGDWCLGDRVEDALGSGQAAAVAIGAAI